METLKDYRGAPIEVGSKIVYPCRASSLLWVQEAEVLHVGERAPRYSGDSLYPYLIVRGTGRGSGYHSHSKKVTITEISRVVVVG